MTVRTRAIVITTISICFISCALPLRSDSVDQSIRKLKARNPDVRAEAAVDLGNNPDPRAVVPLISALKDKDSDVRVVVAEALGKIKDRRAVPALLVSLGDSDPGVREVAASALGNIGDPQATDSLVGLLHDPDYRTRVVAVGALGRIGDPRSIEPIMESLKDTDPHVRFIAARTLGQMRASQAVNSLMAALKDPEPIVVRGAEMALTNINAPAAAEALAASLKETPLSIHPAQYAIADFTKVVEGSMSTQMDVSLQEAAGTGALSVNGHLEFDPAAGKLMTWYSGARHTLIGNLKILGYSFYSDPADPLVFQVSRESGYVYEKGRGVVLTPDMEEVDLGGTR